MPIVVYAAVVVAPVVPVWPPVVFPPFDVFAPGVVDFPLAPLMPEVVIPEEIMDATLIE